MPYFKLISFVLSYQTLDTKPHYPKEGNLSMSTCINCTHVFIAYNFAKKWLIVKDKEVTEEYSKHRPQFSRRLSYKEMQYHEDKKAVSGANDGEDDNIDESLENIDEEELEEELSGDDDEDNEDDDAKQMDNLATRITDLELSKSKKLIGNKKAQQMPGGDGKLEFQMEGKKFPIHKDDPKYFIPSMLESSTEHYEDLTSKQSKKERIKQKKHVTYDDSLITEEIYDKKQEGKSQGHGQADTNYREVKLGKETLPGSQTTVIPVEWNEGVISKRKSKSKDFSEAAQDQQHKEQKPIVNEEEDNDDDDDDDDEEEEEETIEDRIKKVLKKNNVKVSYENKDNEKEMTQMAHEKEKNIWKGNGFGQGSESTNKSSGEESCYFKLKRTSI